MITVPQGGTIAGRSADIRIERPNIGGIVAQAGAAVAQKMGQIKDQQRAVVTQKTQLDMTKELGEERLRFEQMTDPAEIDQQWPQVEAAIRDKYVNQKDASGKPLFTPDEADALGLSFQDLSQRHALALGERTVKLTQSQAEAAWLTARTDIVTTAAGADPDSLAAYLDYGKAAIDQLGKQTGKMPAEIVAEQQAYEAEVMNARLIAAMDQDPAAAKAALEAGAYDVLGPEVKAQRIGQNQAEIDRRAAAGATAGEAETRRRDDAIGKRLDTIGDLTLKGRKVADVDFIENPTPEILAHPGYPKARAAVDLARDIPRLDVMTVAEIDALIATEKDRTIVEAWDDQRLTVLEDMREKKATALATDPKAALVAAGVLPETDLTFDPANPAAFAAGLQDALSGDAHQRDKGYTDQSAIFTKDQKAALKAVLAPGADAGPKVALMTAILDGTGGDANAVLADLEADPVSRRALKVLGVTRDPNLTESILRGQQKIEGKTVVLPSRKEQTLAFDAMTGGAFDDTPAVKAEVMDAALALFADSAAGIDGETTGSDGFIIEGAAYTLYQKSVQRLLGAQPDRTGAMTIGGMQEVNGALTSLPLGISVEQMDDTWAGLGNRLQGGVWTDAGDGQGQWSYAAPDGFAAPDATVKTAPGADARLAPFKAASVYGGVPDLGANPSARWDTLKLQRVGESDIYELVYEQGGRLIKVPQAGADHAYRFRLKDLMRGVRQ